MSRANPPATLFEDRLESPIGPLIAVFDAQERLRALDWSDRLDRMRRLLLRHYGPACRTRSGRLPDILANSIEAYFDGESAALDGIAVETGGTDFQRAVWAALRTIPAGTTRSYAGLALKLGRPKAVRAVGAANGANPLCIVVPCHRVVGTDGALTGYAGGLERKRWLLAHEGAIGEGRPVFERAAIPGSFGSFPRKRESR